MSEHGHDQKGLTRREFIRVGATGATGLALASGLGALNVSAAETPAQLPRRRYGRTGLEISALVGAADWSPDVIPLAVKAGVNYWHKAQRWTAETLPDAIKSQPRESYYLEIVVDRVGGDHKKGHIDEEQHYQFVKQAVARSGVGYYDVFKFHFGYHSVEEAKTNPGMVRAFDRLKKEGLVKHLAISQHHYNNIGGDMAYEIVTYLMDHSPFEAAQFFYTYGDQKEVEDVLALAKKKDFGTIAMKTMGGVGRAATDKKIQTMLAEPRFKGSAPATAMVKWLMSNPNLTAAVIATKNFDQLQENIAAARAEHDEFQRPACPRTARGLQQRHDLPAVRRLRFALSRAHRHRRHPALRALCPRLPRTVPRPRRIQDADQGWHRLHCLRRLPARLPSGHQHRGEVEGGP